MLLRPESQRNSTNCANFVFLDQNSSLLFLAVRQTQRTIKVAQAISNRDAHSREPKRRQTKAKFN